MAKRSASSRVVDPSPYLLPMRVTAQDNGRYLGRCPALPGLNVEADTVQEVLRLAPKVAKALIGAMRDKGVPLPPTLDRAKPPMSIHLVIAA